MAAWQCDFEFRPTGAWPTDYRARLDQIAPRGASWSADLETWGADDGNRINVWLRDGRPREGLMRLDARNLDPSFIAGALEVLTALGTEIRDSAGAVIEPNLGEVMLAVRRSAAFRFVADPEDYLRRLERGDLSDA